MARERQRSVWAALMSAGALFVTGAIAPVHAQQSQSQQETDHVISPALGQDILELIEMEGEEAWREVAAGYGSLLDRSGLTGYERATLLKLRGNAWYQLDELGRTISDWRSAISLNALPAEDANVLRINTGQLLMANDEVRSGIDMIETAVALGVPLNADLAMRLGQAYGMIEDYPPGLAYARQAFDLAEPIERRHYSLLLFYYQSMEMLPDQLGLVEEMVERWPEEKQLWASYASLLARSDREEEAFQVNTVMYVNGLFDQSEEIVRLAQYYSHYDYPYRGAEILERELNAGRVDPEPENFALLANMWRQAREWDRAIPVLRRVATLTGAGSDYEKLGEAFFQQHEYQEADAMFVQALRRGGLTRPGDTWALIGTSRVELDDLDGAEDAFEEALRWEYSRAGAQGWLDFIAQKRINDDRTHQLAEMVLIEECELDIRRKRQRTPLPEEIDDSGQRVFDLSEDCLVHFTPYGDRRPLVDRS